MPRVRRALLGALLTATLAMAYAGTAVAQPSNDSFSGATIIPSVPYTTTEDTTQATLGPEDTAAGQACGVSGNFTNSVWFAYTPPSDQQLVLNTAGSSYSVAFAVLTGTPASFTAVSCTLGSTTFQATQGTTYYIDLTDLSGGTGGTLNLSLTPAIPPNPVVTVNGAGAFSKSGSATLTGTASCSAGSSESLSGTLSQTVGRIATISGSGFLTSPIVCDGTPHPWSLVITPSSGLFRGGHATAVVTMFACNFTCDNKQVTQQVTLR